MNNHATILTIALSGSLALSSCTTTYDAAGRPVQSVSPEGAVVGALAAGLAGYAIAESNDNDDRRDDRRYRDDRRRKTNHYHETRRDYQRDQRDYRRDRR